MRFCGHLKNGAQLLLSDDEIINNALEQEKSGIKPHKKRTPIAFQVYHLQKRI